MRYDEETDHRSIQTAVIGSATSDRPIVLPPDYHDLEAFRRKHVHDTFWCGVLLGGCGKPLSDRRYRDRVCHFAHYRDPNGIPNTCQRRDTGVNSADHLYIRHGLTDWLKSQNHRADASYPDLGQGPGGAVDLRLAGGRRIVRVQMARQELRAWEQAHEELSRRADHVQWLFGPDSQLAHVHVARHGYALRVECETIGTSREVRIGTQGPDHDVDWTDLSQCRMTEQGIITPGLARTRERIDVRTRPSNVSFPLDAANVAFTDAHLLDYDLPDVDHYVVRASLQPAASTVVRALVALPRAIPHPRPHGLYALSGRAAVSPVTEPNEYEAEWLVVAEGVLELADETGDKWEELKALRPAEAPAAPEVSPSLPDPAHHPALTEDQIVESVRNSLASAARNGGRVRWKTLAKKWTRTGLPFPREAQVRLLVAVDAPRAQGKPVLSSVVKGKGEDTGPFHLFSDVLVGLGWSRGMSRTMVEAIHKRELARAYEVYGSR